MPLYICATPIGHLDDVSARLLQTLREAALICAEDTRLTQRLLSRYDIHTPLSSVHQHTHLGKISALADRLQSGESLALVTDSGTPGISDPGPALVREAAARGVDVIPIPGPCALIAALSISGFDAQKFSFLGFLPRKPGKLKKALESTLAREETLVLYESPHRIKKLLEAMTEVAPSRPIVACRELTKKFEETLRGTAAEIQAILSTRKEMLGEWAVVIGGTSPSDEDEE